MGLTGCVTPAPLGSERQDGKAIAVGTDAEETVSGSALLSAPSGPELRREHTLLSHRPLSCLAYVWL